MVTSLAIGRGGLGRFGNQMFTIAGCIGIAVKNNLPFSFPYWKNYDNALFGGQIDDIQNQLRNPLPLTSCINFQDYGYFWGYRDITLQGNWSIDAHLQSPKFFDHCMDLVRHHFTFKNEPEQNDCVAVHYRAGDYIDDSNAYHPRCTKEYYRSAMSMFPEGTRFLIFSDEPFNALEMFGDLREMNDCRVHYGHYLQDFKLMKKCKSFIIANSSFSAMAALLADHPEKKVIAPKVWFGKVADISAKDIYHENWIVI